MTFSTMFGVNPKSFNFNVLKKGKAVRFGGTAFSCAGDKEALSKSARVSTFGAFYS